MHLCINEHLPFSVLFTYKNTAMHDRVANTPSVPTSPSPMTHGWLAVGAGREREGITEKETQVGAYAVWLC